MKKSEIKVLNIANNTNIGGQQMVYMNILKNINVEKFKMDLVVYEDKKGRGFFEDEIERMGVNLYKIPTISKHPIRHIIELKKILNQGKYDVVHQHTDTAIVFINLALAKFCGVKTTIAHSHSSKTRKEFLHKISRKFLNKFSDYKIACSDVAGKFMYGEKANYLVVKNAIDFEKFKFNKLYRNEIREELKLKEGTVLLGSIARFSSEKNHEFLINIIERLKEKQKYVLVLIGDGPLKNIIEKKVKENNLTDKVKFLGQREDNYKIVQAIDIFLLPSFFEGLPITLLEAQIAGCNCVVSSNITDEAIIINTSKEKLNIDDWVEKIENSKFNDRKIDLTKEKFKEFDIKYFINVIEKLYSKI